MHDPTTSREILSCDRDHHWVLQSTPYGVLPGDTVPFKSVRHPMWRVTPLTKFSFQHSAGPAMTIIFFGITSWQLLPVAGTTKFWIFTYTYLQKYYWGFLDPLLSLQKKKDQENWHDTAGNDGNVSIPVFYHMDEIHLMMPSGVKESILLSKNLSIVDFLQFPLPGIAQLTASASAVCLVLESLVFSSGKT